MNGWGDLGCRDMAETIFTHKLSEAQVLQLREVILGKGFVLGSLEYGHFSARKGKCVLQMYLSGGRCWTAFAKAWRKRARR